MAKKIDTKNVLDKIMEGRIDEHDLGEFEDSAGEESTEIEEPTKETMSGEFVIDDAGKVDESITGEYHTDKVDATIKEKAKEYVAPLNRVVEETPKPKPICDMAELSDSEKRMLIENRIVEIIRQTQIPFIPAFVKYRETQASPYWRALVKADYRYVKDAWDFYKINASEPNATDFLELIKKASKTSAEIVTRVVEIDIS